MTNLASTLTLEVFSGMFIEVVGSTISAKVSIKSLYSTFEYILNQLIIVVFLKYASRIDDSEHDNGNARLCEINNNFEILLHKD